MPLEDTFKLYASEGKGTEITVKDVTRWCKEAKVLGANLDMPNIQTAFDKIKTGSRSDTLLVLQVVGVVRVSIGTS